MEDLEKTLGYHFKDKNLLRQALTHSSCSSDVSKNYERLEFLGDRVLGVAMAHLLYNLFPDDPEGNLSPRHTRLVRKETVAAVARELGLNHYIRAENKNLRDNEEVPRRNDGYTAHYRMSGQYLYSSVPRNRRFHDGSFQKRSGDAGRPVHLLQRSYY